jgi:serine kinase of HPr protein (carbohydrate metabolism regulator)
MTTASLTELLLISGRSGVGKSTVAAELHHLLAQAGGKHALIGGDNLDLAHRIHGCLVLLPPALPLNSSTVSPVLGQRLT